MAVTINDEVIIRVEGAAFESPRFTVDQQFPPGRTTRITVSELGALIAAAGPSSLPPNVSLADGVVVSVAGAQDEDPRTTARQQFPTGRTTKLSLAELAALRAVGDPVTLPSNVSANDTIVVRVIGSQDEDPRMTADEQFRPGRTTKMTVGNLIALINAEFPLGQTFSLDFDGVTEFMASSSTQLIGIANAWTIESFVNFADPNTKSGGLFNCGTPVQGDNAITILQRHSVSPGPLAIQVILEAPSGGGIKQNLAWNNVLVTGGGVWEHVVVTWNGTLVALSIGGIDQGAPDNHFTNDALTQTDTARNLRAMIGDLSTQELEGLNAMLSIWSNVLTAAEITELAANFSQDRTVNGSNYVSSATLQHHHRFGDKESPLLGEDLGIASVLIDLEAGSVDITDADRIEDSPST